MLSWLGEVLNDEDAAKGITNWKRRYAHKYKREQLYAKLGPWVDQHLQPLKLEDAGWEEDWADDNIY